MLVIDNIIDYYEKNSGVYNLIFNHRREGIIIWLGFLVLNLTVAGMAVYQLWTGDLDWVTYLQGLGGYLLLFLATLVWTSAQIKKELQQVFTTVPKKELEKASYYELFRELFRKSKIQNLSLKEIACNRYRALKLLEYWRVISYLEEEDFLQQHQIKDLIDFIYKRKKDEVDLAVLTISFLAKVITAVLGVLVIEVLLREVNISFEFGRFMLKGAVTFSFVVIIIRSSFAENRVNKLIEILEDIYFRV